jgi:hypothetical protein
MKDGRNARITCKAISVGDQRRPRAVAEYVVPDDFDVFAREHPDRPVRLALKSIRKQRHGHEHRKEQGGKRGPDSLRGPYSDNSQP